MDLLERYACCEGHRIPVVAQKAFILFMKMPIHSLREASMREMGRRLISVFVSAFLGIGTSQRHFQKDGVDLPAQMLQSRPCTFRAVSVGHRDMRLYVTPLIPADDCRLLQ